MKVYFLLWRCIWADLEFLLAKKETKGIIATDIKRHQEKYLNKNVSFLYALNYSLIMVRSFRSIYSFRLRSEGNKLIKILLLLDEIFLPRCSSVEITGGIYGGG